MGTARHGSCGGHRAHALPARERAADRRAADRGGRAKAGPECSGTCVTLLAVFFALHTDLFNLDWLGAGRLEAGGAVRAASGGVPSRRSRCMSSSITSAATSPSAGSSAISSAATWVPASVAGRAARGGDGANVLNAWAQGAAHRSIGASTAVFAALGMLAAYTWRQGFLRDTPWRARIAPIVAGLGLLAFTGTAGENTDLGRAPVRLHRGVGAGRRDRAARADALAQEPARATALRRARGRCARGGLGRGACAPRVSASRARSRRARGSRCSLVMDSASRAFSV